MLERVRQRLPRALLEAVVTEPVQTLGGEFMSPRTPLYGLVAIMGMGLGRGDFPEDRPNCPLPLGRPVMEP